MRKLVVSLVLLCVLASLPSQALAFRVYHNASQIDGGVFGSNNPSPLQDYTFPRALTVDTNTLFVDATNNRVGMGTITPDTNLHVFQSGDNSGFIRMEAGHFAHLALKADADANTGGPYEWLAVVRGDTTGRFEIREGGVSEPTANRFVILKGGDVGIGTVSPTAKIHIDQDANDEALIATGGGTGLDIARFVRDVGSNGLVAITANNGDPQIRFDVEDSGQKWVIGVDDDDTDKFKIAAATDLQSGHLFTIMSSGNVGIGTTSPAEKLQVIGNITIGNDNTARSLTFLRGQSSYRFTNDGTLKLTYSTDGFTTTIGTALSVTNDGSVGIGTTSPTQKLDVTGNLVLSNTGSHLLLPKFSTSGNYNSLGVIRPSASGSGLSLDYHDGSSYQQGIVLKSSGNVGINTTSPSATLHVKSNSGTDSFFAETNSGYAVKAFANSAGGVGIWAKGHTGSAGIFDRLGNDGAILEFNQDGTTEGSISVSGNTVSYNQFTGAHISKITDKSIIKMGAIVIEERAELKVVSGRETMQPVHHVTTTTVPNDKRVIGVIGWTESLGEMDAGKPLDEYYIYSLGDTGILVTDTNGNIHNGDYLTTSTRAGYGQRQDDDVLHSYTVAKALADVDWSTVPIDPSVGFKWKLIPATLHAG